MFLKMRREAVNSGNEEILFVDALEAFREETKKPFHFVEFWQVVRGATNCVNMSNELVLCFILI